ncbi:MAG: hypothetical protein HRU11_08050 [Parvularculaceae bacterium]|nr:hypothetical protein [Parvularculaceae bacterium]
MSQVNDSVLQRALSSTSDLSDTSLATKILLSRLRREVANDPGSMSAKIDELRAFFAKHTFAERDLAAL